MHRLHVPMQLRKTLASTNVIESAFSIVEQVCKNVKRWHGGDQRERWVGSGLLVAQKQFRRITGHKQIPALIRELEALAPSKRRLSNGERRRRVGCTGAASFNGDPGIPCLTVCLTLADKSKLCYTSLKAKGHPRQTHEGYQAGVRFRASDSPLRCCNCYLTPTSSPVTRSSGVGRSYSSST